MLAGDIPETGMFQNLLQLLCLASSIQVSKLRSLNILEKQWAS